MRELTLRRRRSRVPWVYLVYSRERAQVGRVPLEIAVPVGRVPPEATFTGGGPAAPSILPAQERGHVEGRFELERVIA